MSLAGLSTLAWMHAGALVNRTWTLPIAVVSPTSRCHSRCVSCDWWRTDGGRDLDAVDYQRIADALHGLGTRLVVLTGGEPLLRDDVWEIARAFTSRHIALHLMTSGLALGTHAEAIARHCRRVVLSLDAATTDGYRAVRGVDGLAAIERGLTRLRVCGPHVHVTARATLHRQNFRELPALITLARTWGLDRVSFLAADVTSPAFGPRQHDGLRGRLALTAADVEEFRTVIDRAIHEHAEAFSTGLVAESPQKLRRLADYYGALLGERPFPAVRCNAPTVSIVIDADGAVRPCFFHRVLGNVRDTDLRDIVTRDLPRFRATWRPASNAVCETCVCSLHVGWGNPPWA